MKSIQIVGRKKAGKTSLLVRLLPLLQTQGLRVATVKHSAHPHPLDREGSDSWLHRRAGAQATLAITAVAGSFHFDLPAGAAEQAALVERYLGDSDLVLIEGWKDLRGTKIEVVPADKEGRVKPPRFLEGGELLAVVLAPGVRPPAEDLAPWGTLQGVGAGAPLSAQASSPAAGRAPQAMGSPPPGTAPAGGPLPCYLWEDVPAVAQLILHWRES